MTASAKSKKAIKEIHYTLQDRASAYKERKEQLDLAAHILDTFESKKPLIAEAPTGVGKSLAILMAAASHDGVTVIATMNNNLLEQYCKKDLPFLEKVLAKTDKAFTWGRIKGRSNYLCRDRYQASRGNLNGLSGTEIYDRNHKRFEELAPEEWSRINVNDDCNGKACPLYAECDLYRERKALMDKKIIVTNYDITMISLFNERVQMLPAFNNLVLDEAHGLPEKALNYLASKMTWFGIRKQLRKLDANDSELERVFEYIHERMSIAANAGIDKPEVIDTELQYTKPLLHLSRWLLETIGTETPEDKGKAKARERLRQYALDIADACTLKHGDKRIAWFERTGYDKNIQLTVSPIFPNDALQNMMFNEELGFSVAMTSATIAAATSTGNPDFSSYAESVGLYDDQYSTFFCESPFSYDTHCCLFLFKGNQKITKPSDPHWQAWAAVEAQKCVVSTNGGTFVLCTSNKSLKFIASHLKNNVPNKIIVQDGTRPVPQLLQEFKDTPNAVLVGTSSFWEGVSVEGDQLRSVVLDKIPFPLFTEPLHKAKEAYYKANAGKGLNSFKDLMLYPAIIRLKQGFGRLIRTETDKGQVAILDPRMLNAQYRHQILNSLPTCPLITVGDKQV